MTAVPPAGCPMPLQSLLNAFQCFSAPSSVLFAEKRLKLPGAAPWLAKGVLLVCCWWSGAA
eukprot:7425706-Alexandrium_andersonii.AAC.1